MPRNKVDILELFRSEKEKSNYLNVAAPMVRYSKLEFRTLLRKNNVKLCFTPMIISDSFCRSEEARINEFTTNEDDGPLIAQFAARNSTEMLIASEQIYPYVDGVDLNCGCPQRWAIAKGYGCALLKEPELIKDIIQTLRRNFSAKFSCSVKIRLLQKDIASTVNMCRVLQECGVTFITIHGRTQWQKTSDPVDVAALTEIKKSIQIPVIANGSVRTFNDAERIYRATNCDGVMSAQGLLTNPSLFTGSDATTRQCLQDWVNLAYEADERITFQCFHHHLTFMLEKFMKRKLRVLFNNFTRKSQIFEFLDQQYDLRPEIEKCTELGENTVCSYDQEWIDKQREAMLLDDGKEADERKWSESANGKYYKSFRQGDDEDEDGASGSELDFMGASMFDCLEK